MINKMFRPYKFNHALDNSDLDISFDLSGKFCEKPWRHFEIGGEGKVYACCPAWLPEQIGKLPEQSIMEIWNSETVKEIRKSILDGSFKYCKPYNCPRISGRMLPNKSEIKDVYLNEVINSGITEAGLPNEFNLCYDNSCNLICPSCRIQRINITEGAEYDSRRLIQQEVIDLLFSEPHTQHVTLNITGSGDPFGSKLFRDLLVSIDGTKYPNVVFNFQTNGVMFTKKYFERMHLIHSNIGRVAVSFDAATRLTYEFTRRGGDWFKLIENFSFINSIRGDGVIKRLVVDFVVQRANYHEMPQLLSLMKNYEFVDDISFSLINNWGTYSEEEFKYHAIWRTDNPLHSDFMTVLRDPILSHPKISWGNVLPYRNKALEHKG